MMKNPYLLLVFVFVMSCHPGVIFAAHPICGSIDLYSTSTIYPYGTYYGSEFLTGLDYHKGVVYASSEGDYNLFSVDVSDPYDPTYISRTGAGQHKAYDPTVAEDILYVPSWGSGLRIYDIANPGYFSLLWYYRQSGDPAYWNVNVYRDRAYASAAQAYCGVDYTCGIRIIDVWDTNPPSPNDTLVSLLETSDRNLEDVAIRGSYAFYTDGLDFEVANISVELNPYIMKTFHFPDAYQLHGVRLRGDYAYVYGSNGTPSLIVYKISDPTNPIEVKRMDNGGLDLYLLGDRAFLAGGGGNLITLNISNPANPVVIDVTDVLPYSDAENAWEYSVTGNGRYIYIGTQELYHHPAGPPYYGNNYYRGKLYIAEVFSQDPDDIGPESWSQFSTGEASWDTQYDGQFMPTAADPAWQVYAGSETWASVTNDILRINDTGTSSGDKIRWWRNWEATNSRGTTVLVRARCDSYQQGSGEYPCNIYIEDGKGQVQLAILADKIRMNLSGSEYALDGTQWHTYRITTQGSSYKVYIDNLDVPLLSGPLYINTNRARIMFGSGSGPARQDIYFDYVHCCSEGVYVPMSITDVTPDIIAKVADVAGKGSLSGIIPSTAGVQWSTDGGQTWNSSGGSPWDCQYEADEMPSAALPSWSVAEGSESYAGVSSGILQINDHSTEWGSKVKWARSWGASPSTGTTLLAWARCTSVGGDTTYLGNLFVDDGVLREQLKIMPDRIVTAETGQTYLLDGNQWHIYRITTKNNQFNVYVDEDPTPVLTVTMIAGSTENRVMFGSGASQGTQYIEFDYVYYTAADDLSPGQGGSGGSVTVTCSGQAGDDHGIVTAYQVPFNQRNAELNKIRFSLRDVAGNTGYSPIYNVDIGYPPSPDLDHDGDIDQEDFGLLQECLAGNGVMPTLECMDADLDEDQDVDVEDAAILQQCLGGANQSPGC